LALPIFYGVTSEGLTETRLTLQFRKASRGTAASHLSGGAGTATTTTGVEKCHKRLRMFW
jgi:hypothetical protein